MKKFSAKWKMSKKPKKQRKYALNAPLNIKIKLLSSMLSKDLAKKHNIKSIPVRKGDSVTVMRGQFRKKSGKVSVVDIKKSRIFIDGVEHSKADGAKSPYPIHASKIMITELHSEDKKRIRGSAK